MSRNVLHEAGADNSDLHVMKNMFDRFYTVVRNLLIGSAGKDQGDRALSSLVFSACNQGEGASTMALNFSLACAENSGQRIALVDANLRKPVLHKHFGVRREVGLVELVKGEATLREALVEIKSPEFCFVPSGKPVEKPIILFESSGFGALLDQLHNLFDLIIFDSSPLIRYPETNVLANKLDGLIMVLQAEGTKWEVAQVAKDGLVRARANVLGAILNKKQFFIPEKIYRLV
jgi:protein-tyrosine kinase